MTFKLLLAREVSVLLLSRHNCEILCEYTFCCAAFYILSLVSSHLKYYITIVGTANTKFMLWGNSDLISFCINHGNMKSELKLLNVLSYKFETYF